MKIVKSSLVLAALLTQGAAFATVTDVQIIAEKMQKKTAKSFASSVKTLNDLATSCGYQVQDIADARQNKETVSWTVSATGVDSWLSTVKESIAKAPTEAKGGTEIKVLPKLTRLYAYNESMNINGVTAFMVDFEVNGQVVDTRHYRGFYSKTNWANGDKEFLTAINYATHDLVIKLVNDLENVCQSVANNPA